MVRVPAYEDLPELGAAAMVKPAPRSGSSTPRARRSSRTSCPERLHRAQQVHRARGRDHPRGDGRAGARQRRSAPRSRRWSSPSSSAAGAGAASAVPGGEATPRRRRRRPARAAGRGGGRRARAGVSAGFRATSRGCARHTTRAHRVDATGARWTRRRLRTRRVAARAATVDPPPSATRRATCAKVAAYRRNLAQAFRSDESLRARRGRLGGGLRP